MSYNVSWLAVAVVIARASGQPAVREESPNCTGHGAR